MSSVSSHRSTVPHNRHFITLEIVNGEEKIICDKSLPSAYYTDFSYVIILLNSFLQEFNSPTIIFVT